MKPLAEVLNASISFQWIGNDLIAEWPNFFLGASESNFLVSMSNINAVYFVSEHTFDNGLSKRLLPLFSDIRAQGCGTNLASKKGFWWVINDANEYKQLCKRHGFTQDDFRLYPKVDVVWIPDHESTEKG